MAKEKRAPVVCDPMRMFYTADSYLYSGTLLVRNCDVEGGPGPPERPSIRPPALMSGIILQVLSTEVYLKCVGQIDNPSEPPNSGHTLVELFGLLKAERQTQIRAAFERLRGVWSIPASFEQQKPDEPRYDDFDTVLASMSRIFVQFRYDYEGGTGPWHFTGLLPMAVCEVILADHPEWEWLVVHRRIIASPGR